MTEEPSIPEILIFLTTFAVLSAVTYVLTHTRDLLHPLVLLSPMLIYMYCLRPFLLLTNDQFPLYFSSQQLDLGLLVNAVAVSSLCLGLTFKCRLPRQAAISLDLTNREQQKVFQLACVLGFLAVTAYWYGVYESGGFGVVYGHAKGHVLTGSGYVGEAPMLAFPAIMLVFLSRRGKRIRGNDILISILFASPHLLHGILGARRGPTFLVFATFIFSWYVATGKRPKIIPLMLGLGFTVVLMFFLISHRNQIYVGSDVDVDTDRMFESAFPSRARLGDDVVFGIAQTNVADATDRYHWGKRLAVILFVRPIPRQLWPTKYADSGAGWMQTADNFHGYYYPEWQKALGWRPQGGSSGGFAADLFCEFWWGVAAAGWLLGYGLAYLWRNANIRGGIWTILFLESLILSVYIPTQSMSAFLHRFAFMSIITILLWKFNIGRILPGRQQSNFGKRRQPTGIPVKQQPRCDETT